jgi:aspartate aminotransferase
MADSRSRDAVVSDRMRTMYHRGSAIRQMFEEGLRLKKQYGADQVADVSLGNPDFAPPRTFNRALHIMAREQRRHCYMPNAGYPEVRDTVARHLTRKGLFEDLGGEQIVMTCGAAGALNVVFKTILDPGDEVIVPRPFFVEYRFYVDNHGGRLVLVDTQDNFDLDVDAIEAAITERTRAVLVNSPNNPSGRLYPQSTLEALSTMLLRKERELGRRLFLISDEPYREVIYDGRRFVSPAAVYPNSFMCYSWSKAFSISGERIGYVAVNPALRTDDWTTLMGALAMSNRILGFVNAPALMQRTVAAAIDAEVDIHHYATKRERICATLAEAGYRFRAPEGTFYVFPETPEPEGAFIERAKRHLLLVTPGSAFGREGHFRISFACSDAIVHRACRKLMTLAEACGLPPSKRRVPAHV